MRLLTEIRLTKIKLTSYEELTRSAANTGKYTFDTAMAINTMDTIIIQYCVPKLQISDTVPSIVTPETQLVLLQIRSNHKSRMLTKSGGKDYMFHLPTDQTHGNREYFKLSRSQKVFIHLGGTKIGCSLSRIFNIDVRYFLASLFFSIKRKRT